MKPSAIREILKVTQDPTVISFAAGNPSPESFPADEMAEIAADLFRTQAGEALQYGMTEGYTPLRQQTSARLREKYQIGSENDDLIITSGGQQALELAAKVFLNEGDTLICEDPSFIGALNAFRSYHARLVGCPTDEHGMRMDILENLLRTQPNVKLIYTIPTFQNPSGRTLPMERRREMLALAEKYNVMILEDNPYFELRYSGEPVRAIKSMDERGRVIYAGSYSKVLAPGIRMGFACAPREIIAKMVVAKQTSDVHSNLFFQMVISEYLKRYDLDAHIEGVRRLYRHKRDVMLSAIDRHFDKRVAATRPDGGLFLWVQLPDGCDGLELCARAGERKVAAVPGVSFLVNQSIKCPGIRLNFSLPSDEQIETGIAILGEVIRDYLKEVEA
ncbi:MAG: PLP-dependent aminotransferase family protein [Intestinibacillus sp.]